LAKQLRTTHPQPTPTPKASKSFGKATTAKMLHSLLDLEQNQTNAILASKNNILQAIHSNHQSSQSAINWSPLIQAVATAIPLYLDYLKASIL